MCDECHFFDKQIRIPHLEVCQTCSGSGAESDGLEMARQVYARLTAPLPGRENERLVQPGSARESPLIWTLFGERLGSEQTAYSRVVVQMPPHEALNLRERLLLTEWVDLGTYWDIRTAIRAGSERDE